MPLYRDPDQSRTTPTLLPVGVVYPSLAAQADFGLEDFQMTNPPHGSPRPPMGELFVTDGMDAPVPMGLVAAAGKPPEEITIGGVNFEDLHRGGCEVAERILPRGHLRHVPR